MRAPGMPGPEVFPARPNNRMSVAVQVLRDQAVSMNVI
jgi:hypothetical protein